MNKKSIVSITELKRSPVQILSEVKKDPVYLLKRSKVEAVMVAPELFENLIEALEDKLDLAAIEEAKKDKKKGVELELFRKSLAL